MSLSFKVRLLLALLTLSFIVTALTINRTFSKEDLLEINAKEIAVNLHRKEKIIKEFLADSATIRNFRLIHNNENLQQKYIKDFTDKYNIYFYTYLSGQLTFWSNNNYIPEKESGFKNGSNFIKAGNGSYEVIKYTTGYLSVLFAIPVQMSSSKENKKLKHSFSSDLTSGNNLTLADYAETNSYDIRNNQGKYLFSVKVKPSVSTHSYPRLEFWIWLCAALSGCIFFTSICKWMARNGKVISAICLLTIFFLMIRFLLLNYLGIIQNFNVPIFKQQPYWSELFFKSLGDFLINFLFSTWILIFAYYFRFRIKFSTKLNRINSYLIFILSGVLFALTAFGINGIFYDLTAKSAINLNLVEILNLNSYSWLVVLLLCISVLNLYLLLEIILVVGRSLNLTDNERLKLFLIGLFFLVILKVLSNNFTIFFLIVFLTVFLRGLAFYSKIDKYNFVIFVFTLLAFAAISSIKLSDFQFFKDQENRKILARQLSSTSSIYTVQGTSYPQIIINKNIQKQEIIKNYSYAFYRNDYLLAQNGTYLYPLKNRNFTASGSFSYIEKDGYNHLVYNYSPQNFIIVSKATPGLMVQIASVSFLFLVLLIFFVFVLFIHWLGINFRYYNFRIDLYNWRYLLYRNQILYRTRIQASMLSAIFSTLIIVGLITYFSILKQYSREQENKIRERIGNISKGLESKIFYSKSLSLDKESLRSFFTDFETIDLNLYKLNGELFFSTRENLINYGLQSNYINPLAYIHLNKYKRINYVHKESIGDTPFIAAYKPIKNSLNQTIAYLSIPNYNYLAEINIQINTFLNTLINIYALVLVSIGFFAVFVANKITYPLTLIQKSLSEIKIGGKNEPIIWKRDDEIGRLIKEYNNMIKTLEDNAKKLARSERESAWREMAKQVAHEIKNPLTPLKLGVQLLEKSWKEKDPNFEKKFEKFNKSFIEQIESLSNIASEFSNFAKMPDTAFQEVNLSQVISQSIEVFSKLSDLKIDFENNPDSEVIIKGNQDQLLRIFNNLLKNAVEAIPDYKEGKIQILLAKKNNEAYIKVKDNGKGISEGLRERIFHPNFTTKSSGTGLGLAFVKQAIENMLGTISFDTKDNEGTTFYIYIPLA